MNGAAPGISLSVVVPTCTRAHRLVAALRSFAAQSLDASRYEILIVDNNSSDNTRDVALEFCAASPVRSRYVPEERRGLHHARNRGLLEARGDVVAFGDDDILASHDWLRSLLGEFEANPDTGVAGGKVVPLWEAPPPAWIFDYGTEKTHGVFAYLDLGEERRVLPRDYVYGCNFAVRRLLALAAGGSYPDCFPERLRHLSGTGECGLMDAVRRLGGDVVYLPSAAVRHRADAGRATLEYFISRYERYAVEEVFAVFRSSGRAAATAQLLLAATRRYAVAGVRSRGKVHPGYYRTIRRRAASLLASQTVRVLRDQELYRHITRPSYL